MALIKLCQICGREYEPYRPSQKYCPECKDEAKRRRQRVTRFAEPREFSLPPPGPIDFVRKDIDSAKDGERIVVLSDIHYPFIDEATWRAVRKFTDEFSPNVVVWNGDVGDFYSISAFDKNPQRGFSLNDEILTTKKFLFTHRERWPGQHYYIEGNHEQRFNTYLWKNPELAGLVSLEAALALKEMEFSVLPYGGVLNYLGFGITHGTRYSSLPNGTARMHSQMIGGSGAVGHSHRRGQWVHTDMRGTHTFYEIGCLCRLDPDYVKQRPPNWQQGLLLGVVHRNKVHLHSVTIYSDGFVAMGEFYRR